MIPFHIPTPQGCNIQTFYGNRNTGQYSRFSWNKPVGVSHVYMMLIGSGGDGAVTSGGGSGAVTVWYGAAQHVPDSLAVTLAGPTGGNTVVGYRNVSGVTTLLQANDANSSTAGSAFSANYFTASGFFQSTAGQAGSSSNPGASTTTFLGGGGDVNSITGNYGYSHAVSAGFFQMQPIIVGLGGSGSSDGGIGCGGGSTGKGGPGMVLIASW